MLVFHKNLKFVSIRLNFQIFYLLLEIWNLTPYIVDCPLHCPFHRAYRHFVFAFLKYMYLYLYRFLKIRNLTLKLIVHFAGHAVIG